MRESLEGQLQATLNMIPAYMWHAAPSGALYVREWKGTRRAGGAPAVSACFRCVRNRRQVMRTRAILDFRPGRRERVPGHDRFRETTTSGGQNFARRHRPGNVRKSES